MQSHIRTTHAMRIGFRQISGLSEDHALRIESVRGRGFDSVRDLWLRTRLPPSVLERLANADAFGSLGLSRRDALWAVRALQRAGDKDDLPLFRRVAMPELEPDVDLPPMPPGEQVVEDYRHLHLSLKAHPVLVPAWRARPRAASCATSCCRASATASASPSPGWCWCASGPAPPRA